MAKLAGLSATLVEVHCWCPPEVARERYARRAAQSAHHPAHVTPTLDPALLAEFDRPMGLGRLIEVETTHDIDMEELTRAVSAQLAGR
jgi:hypothetical protein